MSKKARPLGDSSRDQVVGERLGGDDVAPDRDDPAAQRRRDAVGVAVRGDEDVARPDRAAVGLDDEAAVRLAPDRPRANALVQVRAGAIGRGGQPGEIAARVDQAAARARRARRGRRRCRSPRGRCSRGTIIDSTPIAARLARCCSRWTMCSAGPGELEVAALAEVAVDRLLRDQPLDGLVAVERVLVERRPELLAVALDQLARAPLVARVDDPAVAGRGAPAERVRLEQGDRHAPTRELAGGVDAGIAATDDDHVRGAGRSRPERSGRAGIVALHNERRSKSRFRRGVERRGHRR